MARTQYLEEQTFEAFKCNQEKLIEILNHNMTRVQVDVNWLKRGMGWMIGFMASIFLALMGILIKVIIE
jgi:hypothetical protein